MKRIFNKTGLNKRERNHGLTDQQIYHIFQGIVLPIAIEKEKNSKESDEDLGVSASLMAQNMLQAMILKYSKYTREEKVAFVRMAKSKYQKLMETL